MRKGAVAIMIVMMMLAEVGLPAFSFAGPHFDPQIITASTLSAFSVAPASHVDFVMQYHTRAVTITPVKIRPALTSHTDRHRRVIRQNFLEDLLALRG